MARSIWNGVISFGLVSIPVGLQTATQEKDLRFNQLHKVCGTRIKQQRFCPHCERLVETDEIEKGYEVSKNSYVIVNEEDFEALPVPSKHTIEVTAFVHHEEVDPIYFDTTYFLAPTETGRKPYKLLMKALEEKGVCAVAKIAVRNKETLCLLRPSKGQVLLETLFYPDEIKEPEVKVEDVAVDDRELQMALSLVALLEKPFDPAEHKDLYREELIKRIESKAQGGVLTSAPVPVETATIDLMEALRRSLEDAEARKASG
ncbi:MAG: Ku protein [Armatimonadetes bacterium]|nr:Ku protein [Armatimonadota bacterium]